MIDVLYFAWLRERIGSPKERVETDADTVLDLVEELAFADMASVRVAVDQDLADMSASLKDAREVAFFPPMTGG